MKKKLPTIVLGATLSLAMAAFGTNAFAQGAGGGAGGAGGAGGGSAGAGVGASGGAGGVSGSARAVHGLRQQYGGQQFGSCRRFRTGSCGL